MIDKQGFPLYETVDWSQMLVMENRVYEKNPIFDCCTCFDPLSHVLVFKRILKSIVEWSGKHSTPAGNRAKSETP